MKKFLLATAALVIVGLFTATILEAQQGGRGGRGGRGGQRGFGDLLKQFDKNEDGKLSKDELPAFLRDRLLERGDTDKNGTLDAKEIKKLSEGFGQGGRGGFGRGGRGRPGQPGQGRGGFGRGGRGGFGNFLSRLPIMKAIDADGNGEISAEEMKNAANALRKLDKNGDGKLSGDEIQPSFGGGRGGFGRGGRPGGQPGAGGRRGGGGGAGGGAKGLPRRPGGDL